jgi:hypothetical protein
MRVASKIRIKRKSERKVVRCMINVNKSRRYWYFEEDTDDSFKILPKIKDRRNVQDLIDAYINKSRFVWKTVTFFWEGKNIFQTFLERPFAHASRCCTSDWKRPYFGISYKILQQRRVVFQVSIDKNTNLINIDLYLASKGNLKFIPVLICITLNDKLRIYIILISHNHCISRFSKPPAINDKKILNSDCVWRTDLIPYYSINNIDFCYR